MKVPFNIKNEIIEIYDNANDEKMFLIKKGNEWEKITEEEYNNIIEVK